ncbi:SDR family NAD(P)-dependent oxidoreductase [Thalassococcus sp. CAU 1522]|uniref:SDR family NAD(P)-dependent oxidoreductase n=1 Tax=Thalassococcus arenae TaxID=2851652 RepID=A0ABS6NDE0_9RHOB|nr:SDR family NAD(P)-dependent oxidoreductase [Thalassococcus arenae]MBV2361605.1 SDR family NAD(P)-dependent oxidoreductase [Thalassococcus arenae]
MNIDGQVALVTGGASGLGAATARHLASLGAKVAVLDHDGDKAAQVADEIGGFSQRCDITDETAVADAVAAAKARFDQPPRIVVNCAGVGLAARIVGRDGKVSTDIFRKVIAVNLFGTYHLMTYAVQAMMDAAPLETGERGVIINTASAAYEDGQIGQTAYAASKGAIAAMCLPAARELARPGIRVVAIAPGLFHTPMMESLPEETTQEIVKNIPFPHRLGDPAEFAQMVADVARNAYLNGTVIRLDGAVRLPPR